MERVRIRDNCFMAPNPGYDTSDTLENIKLGI
jgi:hypothetical protein